MRRCLVILAAGLFAAAALVAPERAAAQQGPKREREVHLGAGSCAAQACHGGREAGRAEYKVWATRDKHAQAYDILGGELGRRIGERLGIEPAKSPECLNCHGTVGVDVAESFDPHDGVSCELCHGGAKDWLGPHASPEWKKKTPGEKERLGLRDLTTPAKRAAMCASCHVGGKGRDITHTILAAGHPPLSFDAATFERAMPPHWEDEDKDDVAAWIEGAKASAAARLHRITRVARQEKGWPEFALFDCYACHHPIYSGSVYETEGGRPGDLSLDLPGLKVLLIAAGDPALIARFRRLVETRHAPDASRLDLADFAGRAAEEVTRITTETPRDELLGNLDRHLARVVAGGTRTPRGEMEQFAFAILALAPDRDAEDFRAAYAALDAAMAGPYDAEKCAGLARTLIAAARR